MSSSNVLNIFIYGFTYIECFFPMNIYRSLYEGIIGKDENKDFSNHRVFDPFFSYLGIIAIAFFFIKDESQDEIDKRRTINSDKKLKDSNFALTLIYNGTKEYLENKRAVLYYILILILWIIEENLLLIYVDIFQDLDFWFFELIFVSLIHSRKFQIKIFSHQKLGVAISVLVGSALKIYSISITLSSGKEEVFYAKYKPLISFALLYFLLKFLNTKN